MLGTDPHLQDNHFGQDWFAITCTARLQGSDPCLAPKARDTAFEIAFEGYSTIIYLILEDTADGDHYGAAISGAFLSDPIQGGCCHGYYEIAYLI